MFKEKSNLNLIQVLRGIASLLVVLLHTTVNSKEIFKKEFLGSFFSFGGAGVDIFFVLSGFIITYTSAKGLTQPRKMLPFLGRRFVRIFPTYWIIFTLFILLQLALPSFYKTHYNFTASNICATLFLLPGHPMVNGVSWTLSYELFFYALFSIAFLLPGKKLAFALAMLYALVIVVLALLGYNYENGNKWIDLLTSPMNIEFFMGILAAVLVRRIPLAYAIPLIVSGSLLFLGGGIFTDLGYRLLPTAFNRVVIFGIPSFLIITGLVKYELNKKIRIHNFLLLLGEGSYSLYLVHLPVVVGCIRLMNKFNIQNDIILHALLLLMIVMICCASILFFKCIERPIITKLNALKKSQTTLDHKTRDSIQS